MAAAARKAALAVWGSLWNRDTAMSEMVKRVAKAIADPDQYIAAEFADPNHEWESVARAVLAAMREPTEEMLSLGDSAIPRAEADETGRRMMGREVALEAWRAMIDEALKP